LGVVRRETGKEERVQVPYSEGLANHAGTESCVAYREVRREALTGVRVGQPLSREIIILQGADAFTPAEAIRTGALLRVPGRPCVVVDTGMHVRSLFGNREIS